MDSYETREASRAPKDAEGAVHLLGALIHDRFTSLISHGDSLDRTRRQRKRILPWNGRTLSRVVVRIPVRVRDTRDIYRLDLH